MWFHEGAIGKYRIREICAQQKVEFWGPLKVLGPWVDVECRLATLSFLSSALFCTQAISVIVTHRTDNMVPRALPAAEKAAAVAPKGPERPKIRLGRALAPVTEPPAAAAAGAGSSGAVVSAASALPRATAVAALKAAVASPGQPGISGEAAGPSRGRKGPAGMEQCCVCTLTLLPLVM